MEYIATRQDNELYHYGVKGMKWGVRRARNDQHDEMRESKKAHDSLKKEYKKHKKLVRKYVEIGGNPINNKYRKQLTKSDEALVSKTEKYLNTLSDYTVNDLLRKDKEHGKYYVNAQLANPRINYDDFLYVSDSFAKKHKF